MLRTICLVKSNTNTAYNGNCKSNTVPNTIYERRKI